jgi:hypothetical protein
MEQVPATTTDTTPPSTETTNNPLSLLDTKATAAPEVAYTPLAVADLKLPEGFTANEENLGKFLEITNGAKLPVDVTEKLIGLQAELTKQASQQASELWEKTQGSWQAEVKKDPEIGGQQLDENLSHVVKLIDRIGGPQAQAIKEAFSYTGAGNHPAIIKFLVKVGKEFSDPTPVLGSSASAPTDIAALLFPTQGK